MWSSDATTFWWIDSPEGKVWAFDFDAATGAITNRRVAIDHFVEGEPSRGYPDGCCIDACDKIWIAGWEGGGCYRYDPFTGELLEFIATPGAKRATACAIGGADMRTLFITTASCGLSEEDIVEQPNAGALFGIQLEKGEEGTAMPPYGGSPYPPPA